MKSLWWLLPGAFAVMVLIMWMTAPPSQQQSSVQFAGDGQVMAVVQQRCTGCHSAQPTQPGFSSPPAGLVLESPEQIKTQAERIYQAAVATRTMPIGNLTGMTDEERQILGQWFKHQVGSGG